MLRLTTLAAAALMGAAALGAGAGASNDFEGLEVDVLDLRETPDQVIQRMSRKARSKKPKREPPDGRGHVDERPASAIPVSIEQRTFLEDDSDRGGRGRGRGQDRDRDRDRDDDKDKGRKGGD